AAHDLGGFVAPCYGRYRDDSPQFFTRIGGHCITMNGIDACTPAIRFRDPANDFANTTQSGIRTHIAGMVPVTAVFRVEDNGPYLSVTRWRLVYESSLNSLDGWIVLMPRIALTADQSLPPRITLHRPLTVAGSVLPPTQVFNPPTGIGPLLSLAIHP